MKTEIATGPNSGIIIFGVSLKTKISNTEKISMAFRVRERWENKRTAYARSLEGKINNRLALSIMDFCDTIIYRDRVKGGY
jgi:hypothetical protein